MGGSASIKGLSAVLLVGISSHWVHFSSTIYPYSIDQPASFKHVIYTNAAHQKLDYFSPPLGSSTTDVTILAVPGTADPSTWSYLKQQGGSHLHRTGTVSISGHSYPLTAADFTLFGSKWTVEQVSFTANGMAWRLTASYDPKYKSLRSTMLRMLRSFRLGSGARR